MALSRFCYAIEFQSVHETYPLAETISNSRKDRWLVYCLEVQKNLIRPLIKNDNSLFVVCLFFKFSQSCFHLNMAGTFAYLIDRFSSNKTLLLYNKSLLIICFCTISVSSCLVFYMKNIDALIVRLVNSKSLRQLETTSGVFGNVKAH